MDENEQNKSSNAPSVASKPSSAETAQSAAEDRLSTVARLRDAWRDTVGRYATDDGETKNLFSRLVDFGQLSKDEAVRLATETRERIEQNRRELDKRVEESIKRATARMHVPTTTELKDLSDQTTALESRLAVLEQRKNA